MSAGTAPTVTRTKGSGSRRGDRLWRVRRTIDGQVRDFYGNTLVAANAKARAANAPRRRSTPMVSDWLATWLEDKRSTLKPQTWRRYRRLVDQLVPAFAGVRLAEVSPEDVRRLHTRLRASRGSRGPLSGTTQHHVHVVLGIALQAAFDQGLLAANPCRVVKAPRQTVKERITLSREESDRLLVAAQGDPYEAFYVLALTAGLRIGELLALTWRDVDLDAGVLTVSGTVVTTLAGKLAVQPPKTASARRQITLPKIALEALRTQERTSVYVFPNAAGGLMAPGNMSKRNFRALVKSAELPDDLTPHSLRHTCATHLLEDGVPAHVVSRMLGHASVAITLSIYAHVTPRMQDAAVRAMDARYCGKGARA